MGGKGEVGEREEYITSWGEEDCDRGGKSKNSEMRERDECKIS